MSRKFAKTRCVHCLKYFDQLTSDHVFPKAWYPETTPPNLEKWQVPACFECNSKYGKLEDQLLSKLSWGLEPDAFESLGVTDKIQRSVNPKYARSKRDREKRLKARKNLLKSLISPTELQLKACLPGFGLHQDFPLEAQPGLFVSASDLTAFGVKLVKGITYVLYKKYIESDYKIEIVVAHKEKAIRLIEIVEKYGAQNYCGPGIRIGVANLPDDSKTGVYDIEIWGKLRIYGMSFPAELEP